MSTERIIVLRSVADKFRTLLVESAEEMFGEAHPPLVLVTPASVNRIRKLVSGAESKGASILFGTIQNIQANTAALRPIIIENVTKAMDLYYSESFGPVVSIFTVDTEQEAIMLANDTEYGLSAAIYTENLRRGLRIAQQIESGYDIILLPNYPTRSQPICITFPISSDGANASVQCGASQ